MFDMTQGSIFKNLIRFAIPMVLGNLLQLTYNAVDSIIIGKCLGENALAAVSTSNPIMTIMVLGASGVSIGASVIMSRLYGAKDMAGLKREFSTTVIFSTFFSLAVFLVGILSSDLLLRSINTPAQAMPMASLYLKIIFVGFLFTFQYNILAASMRAIGDSKTAVWFLGLSCLLNGCLDVVFVAWMKLGIAGAGLATAVAEGVSFLCCLVYIYRKMPALQLHKGEWVVDKALLGETLRTGSLTALQQAAQPVGKVLIQSVVNAQGIVAIGAFNAVCRVDDFACIPAQSIGSGIMTCTAQNRGAGNKTRMRESWKQGTLLALCYFPIVCGVTLLFRRPVMTLLTPSGSREMITMGMGYLAVKAWLFVMPCLTNAVQGFFRGLGKMNIVLFATVLQISVRALCVMVLVPRMGIVGEAWGCMIGWGLMLIFEFGYYFHLKKTSDLL